MSNKARWILVSDGTPQTMYAGKTELTEEEIDECITGGKPVELAECRAMRTMIMPNHNGSFTMQEVLTPLSVSRTGIRLKTLVFTYFWPDENDATNYAFLDKVKAVEKAERAHRAAEAGLVTVDNMPTGPGGKLLS